MDSRTCLRFRPGILKTARARPLQSSQPASHSVSRSVRQTVTPSSSQANGWLPDEYAIDWLSRQYELRNRYKRSQNRSTVCNLTELGSGTIRHSDPGRSANPIRALICPRPLLSPCHFGTIPMRILSEREPEPPRTPSEQFTSITSDLSERPDGTSAFLGPTTATDHRMARGNSLGGTSRPPRYLISNTFSANFKPVAHRITPRNRFI